MLTAKPTIHEVRGDPAGGGIQVVHVEVYDVTVGPSLVDPSKTAETAVHRSDLDYDVMEPANVPDDMVQFAVNRRLVEIQALQTPVVQKPMTLQPISADAAQVAVTEKEAELEAAATAAAAAAAMEDAKEVASPKAQS